MLCRTRVALLKHTLTSALILSLVALLPPLQPAATASTFLSDTASHPPPTSGGFAYYDSYGAFGPNQPGFPAKGQSFVDPVFGNTITRLTNELGAQSFSDIYSKNGYFNADNTLMVHNTPGGRQLINPTTGAVVRPTVPGNDNSSFDPVNPDIWWWYTFGGTTLNKYSVSTGTSTVVKTFSEPIGNNGGSIDWIDRTGRYMVLHLGSSWRMYDVQADVLYANPIPDSYGNNPGYTGITPDGNYIITTQNGNPNAHRSWAVNHTTRSVATAGVIFWTVCGDHGDFVSASNGKTYWVVMECDSVAAVYAVDVSIPQSNTNKPKQLADNRQLFDISWSDSGHFSRVSKGALQDWVFASIESGDDTFGSAVSSWRPYKQEILMANVLTGEVRRLAHHRSRSPFSNYYYMPRVSASWDGGLVAWASNFGYSSGGYADIYIMKIDTGGSSGGGSGGGTPSPVTVSFINPTSGATVSGTVTVSVAAGGGTGSGYTYTVTAGGTTIYTGTNATFSWNTTGTNGTVAVAAAVTDSGGAAASTTINVVASNTTATTPPPPAPPAPSGPSAAQIAYAQSFASQAWPNYKSWDTLPQYLKDEALQVAAAGGPAVASSAAVSAPAPVSSGGSVAAAQAFALQAWPNYKSWDSLPQYLKNDAMQIAGGGGAAPVAASPSAVSSGGSTAAAQAFALQAWPNYKSWESLPQYLKNEAMQVAGGGGAAPVAASSGPSGSLSAQAFALQAWPNYKSWDTLPQYLKDDAMQAVAN